MTDFDYMVESVTADLVVLLMERLGMDLQTALDTVYTSDTFAKLSNPATELYYQSPYYIYSVLFFHCNDYQNRVIIFFQVL